MIGRLFQRASKLEAVPVGSPSSADLFTSPDDVIPVTQAMMLGTPACFRAVAVLMNAMRSLPLGLFTRLPNGGREPEVRHPVSRLYRKPAPGIPRGRWLATQMAWMATRGNAFNEIVTDSFGEPRMLLPIPPWRVQTWATDTEVKFYRVFTSNSGFVDMDPSSILHFRWISVDGLMGLPPIAIIRRALGELVSLEQYGYRFFANDAKPAMVLTHPQRLTPEQKAEAIKEWLESNGGAKSRGTALLSNGVSVKELSFTAVDSQMLEQRAYLSAIEMARAFGTPVYKLMDQKHPTYNNIEHYQIEFATDSVRPHAIEIEEELDNKLLSGNDADRMFTELNIDGLLRGDIKTRYEAHRISIEGGWANPDEVRAIENKNQMPDGQGTIYTRPANMTPVPILQQRIESGAEIGSTIDDLIAAAVNRAARRAQKIIAAKTVKLTAGSEAWQNEVGAQVRAMIVALLPELEMIDKLNRAGDRRVQIAEAMETYREQAEAEALKAGSFVIDTQARLVRAALMETMHHV